MLILVDYTNEKPVFNKIVGLKDSWGKKTAEKPKEKVESKKQQNKVQVKGEVEAMNNNTTSII